MIVNHLRTLCEFKQYSGFIMVVNLADYKIIADMPHNICVFNEDLNSKDLNEDLKMQ